MLNIREHRIRKANLSLKRHIIICSLLLILSCRTSTFLEEGIYTLEEESNVKNAWNGYKISEIQSNLQMGFDETEFLKRNDTLLCNTSKNLFNLKCREFFKTNFLNLDKIYFVNSYDCNLDNCFPLKANKDCFNYFRFYTSDSQPRPKRKDNPRLLNLFIESDKNNSEKIYSLLFEIHVGFRISLNSENPLCETSFFVIYYAKKRHINGNKDKWFKIEAIEFDLVKKALFEDSLEKEIYNYFYEYLSTMKFIKNDH